MLGAIVGDIAGSTYESQNFKFESCKIFADRSIFTDDTVLTLATANHLLFGGGYSETYQTFGKTYPSAGYGKKFNDWLNSSNPRPYGSWGNGSAMRVSPIGWAFDSLDSTLAEAQRSAIVLIRQLKTRHKNCYC